MDKEKPLEEKERMVAGISNYLVIVGWVNPEDQFQYNTVVVEAESENLAKAIAKDAVWGQILKEFPTYYRHMPGATHTRDGYEIFCEGDPLVIGSCSFSLPRVMGRTLTVSG